MSEFELRVTPSSGPNGSVWFYDLAIEREGLRVESSLRAMDLDALRRSCEWPVEAADCDGTPVVVASDGRDVRLMLDTEGVRVSLPVDASQRRQLRDLCEQGLAMNRMPRQAPAHERVSELHPVRKGHVR